jgi:hypothetical protein
MAEVTISGRTFHEILMLIARLRVHPPHTEVAGAPPWLRRSILPARP